MLTKGQRLAAAAAAALAEESFEPEPEADGEVAGGSGGGRRGKSKKKGTRYRRPNSNCKGTASCSSRTAKKSSSINLSPSTSAKMGKRYKKGGSNPTTDEQQRPTSERRAHAASSTEAGNHTATNATSNKATISPDVDGGDDVIEGVATTPKKKHGAICPSDNSSLICRSTNWPCRGEKHSLSRGWKNMALALKTA